MRTLICPYTEGCIFYQNWTEKVKDRRVNVIFDNSEYSCLVLDCHNEICAEGGVTFNDNIHKRIDSYNTKKNLNLGDVGCSHITLLNLLKKNK